MLQISNHSAQRWAHPTTCRDHLTASAGPRPAQGQPGSAFTLPALVPFPASLCPLTSCTPGSSCCLAVQTSSCHISSDDTCHDSLGCADLEISAVGRYMETYTNFAVTVDPVAAYPPYGPGCGERGIVICPGGICRSGPGSMEARQMRHNLTRGARTAPKVGAKPAQAATQHYYGGEEPLPEMVWVYDESYGPLPFVSISALVYGGQMSVLDRHTKREVATGWMELVQLSLFWTRTVALTLTLGNGPHIQPAYRHPFCLPPLEVHVHLQQGGATPLQLTGLAIPYRACPATSISVCLACCGSEVPWVFEAPQAGPARGQLGRVLWCACWCGRQMLLCSRRGRCGCVIMTCHGMTCGCRWHRLPTRCVVACLHVRGVWAGNTWLRPPLECHPMTPTGLQFCLFCGGWQRHRQLMAHMTRVKQTHSMRSEWSLPAALQAVASEQLLWAWQTMTVSVQFVD